MASITQLLSTVVGVAVTTPPSTTTTLPAPSTTKSATKTETTPSSSSQTNNWNSPDYFRLLDEANNGTSITSSNSSNSRNFSNISSNSFSVSGISGNVINTNLSLSTTNQTIASTTFQYQIDVNRSGDGGGARPSYETGSNFMLLLEDFGEYFYNYNGTGITNTSAGYEFQTNCSVSNSSCVELSGGK